MNLPNDPVMLMSVLNTKLRDEYSSLEELCKALGLEQPALEEKLRAAGFIYRPELNQFR
ncbi:MAG: DUF4250 domain-containing protein [Ruminococcus sp.]|nr:DUF4250 domain-containing protein [Ruminococcus sp.]